MIHRTLLLLLLLLGLAAGAVLPRTACGQGRGAKQCGGCCPQNGAGCCAKSSGPVEPTPPQTLAASQDLKQAVVPIFIRVGEQTERPISHSSNRWLASTQQPALSRLEVTCIRLI
jgi:hypothetical protein